MTDHNIVAYESNSPASTIWLFHQPMKQNCQPCNHNFHKLPENPNKNDYQEQSSDFLCNLDKLQIVFVKLQKNAIQT